MNEIWINRLLHTHCTPSTSPIHGQSPSWSYSDDHLAGTHPRTLPDNQTECQPPYREYSADGEHSQVATVKEYLTVQTEGSRVVQQFRQMVIEPIGSLSLSGASRWHTPRSPQFGFRLGGLGWSGRMKWGIMDHIFWEGIILAFFWKTGYEMGLKNYPNRPFWRADLWLDDLQSVKRE